MRALYAKPRSEEQHKEPNLETSAYSGQKEREFGVSTVVLEAEVCRYLYQVENVDCAVAVQIIR
jgi:hypothetical protein